MLSLYYLEIQNLSLFYCSVHRHTVKECIYGSLCRINCIIFQIDFIKFCCREFFLLINVVPGIVKCRNTFSVTNIKQKFREKKSMLFKKINLNKISNYGILNKIL